MPFPRIALRTVALAYLGALLVAPVAMVFWRTFEHGFGDAWAAVTTPAAKHAFLLTLVIALIAVPANALVDLPLALSPIVVGLAFLLLYGRGGWLENLPFDVVFALPGMVLATIFVSLPFVVREVVPVLREIGTEQEQAASTL